MVTYSKPDIGTAANDGTGTVWRTAWDMVEKAITGLEDHQNDVTGNPHSVTQQQTGVEYTHGHRVASPGASEDDTLFFTNVAITVTRLAYVLVGGTTPSVTVTIRHSTDRSLTGNEVVTSGNIITSTTTATEVTIFNDATVPANSWVWLETTASSGSPTELAATVTWTVD